MSTAAATTMPGTTMVPSEEYNLRKFEQHVKLWNNVVKAATPQLRKICDDACYDKKEWDIHESIEGAFEAFLDTLRKDMHDVDIKRISDVVAHKVRVHESVDGAINVMALLHEIVSSACDIIRSRVVNYDSLTPLMLNACVINTRLSSKLVIKIHTTSRLLVMRISLMSETLRKPMSMTLENMEATSESWNDTMQDLLIDCNSLLLEITSHVTGLESIQ
jgi:hypothetical protein